MASSHAIRWFTLSLLLPLAQGFAVSTPTPTASQSSENPSPTRPAGDNALERRGFHSTTTSFVGGSICGWAGGALSTYSHSSICSLELFRSNFKKEYQNQCARGWQCLFHSSDSLYPAAWGCCQTAGSKPCFFITTCYDGAQVSATPSLLNLPAHTFCTDPASPYCLTQTFPELGLGGPIIGASCEPWTRQGTINTATFLTEATTTTVSLGTTIQIVYALSSASYVDGSLMQRDMLARTSSLSTSTSSTTSSSSLLSPSEPSPTAAATATATATAPSISSSSTTTSSSSSSSSHSSSAGIIAGSVVGSVVGVTGITAAIIMFIILRRRTKQEKDKDSATGDAAGQRPELDGNPYYEADGKVVANTSNEDTRPRDFGNRPRELESESVATELPG